MGGGQRDSSPTPAPTPAPPPPERTAAQTQNAAIEQRQRYMGSAGGRSNTLLTSGTGADTTTTAVKLLGNVGK